MARAAAGCDLRGVEPDWPAAHAPSARVANLVRVIRNTNADHPDAQRSSFLRLGVVMLRSHALLVALHRDGNPADVRRGLGLEGFSSWRTGDPMPGGSTYGG